MALEIISLHLQRASRRCSNISLRPYTRDTVEVVAAPTWFKQRSAIAGSILSESQAWVANERRKSWRRQLSNVAAVTPARRRFASMILSRRCLARDQPETGRFSLVENT